ncbi:MAG: hypothetical protein WD737_06250 [Gemmatimonadota bacterium]
MQTALRLFALILALNVIRYVVAGPLEQMTVLPPLFTAMAESPDYFNNSFSTVDWVTSFLYNGAMWGIAVLVFHSIHPQLPGGWLAKSVQSYGLLCLFFLSVSAIYMNHYSHPNSFYLYNMGSAVIAFGVVAVANTILYPRLVARRPQPS